MEHNIKLNANVNINNWSTYINISKKELEKLVFNIQGKTCLKITKQGFVFNFKPKVYLDDNLDDLCE